MVVISLRIENELKEILDRVANSSKLPRSEIVRRLITYVFLHLLTNENVKSLTEMEIEVRKSPQKERLKISRIINSIS